MRLLFRRDIADQPAKNLAPLGLFAKGRCRNGAQAGALDALPLSASPRHGGGRDIERNLGAFAENA